MVVRLDAGREAVRAYVEAEAARGLPHVVRLVSDDRDSILAAIDGLTGEQGTRETIEGEWTPVQVMAHLNSSLPRSLSRLQAMSEGQRWANSPAAGGQGSTTEQSFEALRSEYRTGMQAIIDALASADGTAHLGQMADHAAFGPFNWLQWAVYSHHVHTSDHIGQLGAARARLEQGSMT